MSEARSVLGVICSAYDSFFEAEKKIADYIMEHKEQAVDMTVGELAKASGTSDATVSRFCRRCGFKGFQNLKLTLAREILEEEHQSQEVTNDIDRTDLEQSLKNILANKIAELTETIKMMDIKNLEVILDKLEHARMVQLAAVGNTIPVALDGAFKQATILSLMLPILALAVPIFDNLFVIFKRFSEGKPVYQADRSQIHFRLQEKGLNITQIVTILSAISLVCSIISILLLMV